MEAGPNHPARYLKPYGYLCHCGRDMNGSDHCPACGCEEYESGCDASHKVNCNCIMEEACYIPVDFDSNGYPLDYH